MRKLVILIMVAFILVPSLVQSSTSEPSDTIVLISGRKVIAHIQGVSPSRVTYIPIGKENILEMDRKQVHKIAYRNGRVENFNSLALQMVDEGNWQTIILTDNKDEVEGFFALGEVQGKSSPQSRNARAAQRSADIRLKKRAANMGGLMVLITSRETKGGYGETPSHVVNGIVYGFEAPSD